MGELTGELVVELVTTADHLEALGPAWEALEAIDPQCSPFNTFRWNWAWWSSYGLDRALRVVVVRDGDRVVGIAPFHLTVETEHRLLRRRVLRFVGSGGDTSPDYLGVVAGPERREAVEAAVLDAVFAQADWDTLRLRDVRAGSSLDRLLEERLGAAAGTVLSSPLKRVLVCDLPATWDAFRASLPTKRRKQLNHRVNRLDRAGDWRLRIAQGASERADAMDALGELHRARWRAKGAPGKFDSPAYNAFHAEIVERFAERDELWLVTLELEGEIIGVMYLFRWREQLLFFQSGFAPEHEALSPGHVMFGWVYRQAIERGLARADMLKGEYHYKTAWARSETFLADHAFQRPGLSSRLSALRLRLQSRRASSDAAFGGASAEAVAPRSDRREGEGAREPRRSRDRSGQERVGPPARQESLNK